MSKTFKRTPRQIEASSVLGNAEAALWGGSRSGKTFIIIRSIIIRASKVKSRHLIARFRFNHVKTSIWYDTLPKVLSLCFPNLQVEFNKSDWFIKLSNGSEIWIAGIDDKERVEKILGNEYSTIYLNECSQIKYDAVMMLQTRLAEKTDLVNKMWYDFNPPSKKHWTYRYFVEGINPVSLKPLHNKVPYMVMNPKDNIQNLPKDYLDRLEQLPKKQRERFLLGEFTTDTEGALWDYELILQANSLKVGEIERTVVAIDPAVSANKDSDETGIIVASKSGDKFIVQADYSIVTTTQTWATIAINAYHKHNADVIVAETNQGGDLVENVLRLNGFTGRFIKIHAKRGKVLRAEPIVALYEQGRVAHDEGLEGLESEMMDWVPMNVSESPDRIDAMVYALTELSGDDMSDLFKMMAEQ